MTGCKVTSATNRPCGPEQASTRRPSSVAGWSLNDGLVSNASTAFFDGTSGSEALAGRTFAILITMEGATGCTTVGAVGSGWMWSTGFKTDFPQYTGQTHYKFSKH